MEAEDGFDPSIRKNTTTAWRGDWASFKRRLRAAGTLNGIRDAMRLGEALAAKGGVLIIWLSQLR